MRNKLKRRRLVLRAAALCFVLALLCSCLLPVFAEGTLPADSVPGQMQENEPEPEPELPAEEPLDEEPDEPAEPDEPELFPEEKDDDLPEEEPEIPEELPEVPEEPDEPDSPLTPEMPGDKLAEQFETTYLFWLSEKDESEGGLPYAEQTVASGEELLMPEEPEADGKQFRYWYTRDEEGAAVRFVPSEEPLWPEENSECSLYAYFTAEETSDELTDPAETDIPALDEQEPEPEEEPLPEENETLPETEEDAQEETALDIAEEDALLTEEAALDDTEDVETQAWGRVEEAAIFLLKTPTSKPGSNDPSQWAPDNSECRWIGEVNTNGAIWGDGKNVTSNVESYIVSWPGGSTEPVWTLKPGDDYWDDVINEIWDKYRATIEKETGIIGLEQDDLEAITVTPYKISRNNGTDPDKHIDCTISVKSKKSFTARFNVRAPGEDEYTIVDSREYKSGERVEKTTVDIAQSIDIGGVLYVFDGWYREEQGPAGDEPSTEKLTENDWAGGYTPEDDELENGVVNFYAYYVLAEVQPDMGVTLSFFAAPLLLCAGAAGFCCTKTKKEEDE